MADLRMPDMDKIVHIPVLKELSRTGVYFLLFEEVVVYVGKAKNIRTRIGSHISDAIGYIANTDG